MNCILKLSEKLSDNTKTYLFIITLFILVEIFLLSVFKLCDYMVGV